MNTEMKNKFKEVDKSITENLLVNQPRTNHNNNKKHQLSQIVVLLNITLVNHTLLCFTYFL